MEREVYVTKIGELGTVPVVAVASAPLGTEALDVQWVRITVPGAGIMLAAVARPPGVGTFPTVLFLHGSHGFAQEYVRLSQALAATGVLAMAAGWFQGGSGLGARFITPINNPEAPPMPDPASPEAVQTVDSLVQAACMLPGADPERIGIFGHSRGGGAAANYILQVSNVGAIVLNSCGYPSHLIDMASRVKAPILMMHGTADSPDDGGSAATNIGMAYSFEARLKMAGKPVESVHYAGGRHNSIFTSAAQRHDAVQQTLRFFRRHIGG